MKKIGVVICNYNKKDYVINCINSLKEQEFQDFDIYVVDNASTDGSIEAIEKLGEEVRLIKNEKNLGGSGGFNSGMRKAMEKDYEYLLLLDNDVILDSQAVKKLNNIMDSCPEIGMQGCLILRMDYPDVIQEFAPVINYETITFELSCGGEKNDLSLPEIQDCDYVPACAMMVRVEVIKEIGLMPEENFIYYDDIEWGVKCHRAGYRVVANSTAKAWHKGGAAINPTTFGSYYINRNKYKFFMKYMSTDVVEATPEMIEARAENVLLDMFEGLYMCNFNQIEELVPTRMEAFIDALNDKKGKAEEYKIRIIKEKPDKFKALIEGKKRILIYRNGLNESTRKVLNRFLDMNRKGESFEITIVDTQRGEKKKMLGVDVMNIDDLDANSYDLVLHMCFHVCQVKQWSDDRIWIDGWSNLIRNKEDWKAITKFEEVYGLFKQSFKNMVLKFIENKIV